MPAKKCGFAPAATLADEHNPFLMRKAPQMFGHHRVLALTLLKLHQRDVVPGQVVFQLRTKLRVVGLISAADGSG
jgi:hypothetical protein